MFKLIFGVLSQHERTGWIHPSIFQFFCDLPFNKEVAYRVVPLHAFVPASSARNIFCRNFKDSDVDWIVMIDNDMKMPENFLDTLKDAPKDADILVPVFYMWNQSELSLKLCWGKDAPSGFGKFDPGFHELTKCGTGAIFIRPHVFRAMEYPYFRYLHNEDGSLLGTEDIEFCRMAKEKGFKVYGNTAVQVGHMHSVDLGSMWEWLNKTLDSAEKAGVPFTQKDSGGSPDGSAETCSVEAR